MADRDYAGATTRTSVDQARKLAQSDPARWRIQTKVDGCYVRVVTGELGQVTSVTTRNGRETPQGAELLGNVIAPPRSVVIGELEAHTEAGNSAHQSNGYRKVHIFDALQLDGVDMSRSRYYDRYSAIMRAHISLSMTVRGDATKASNTASRRNELGQYKPSQPINWRLAPVVEQWTAHEFDEAWQETVVRGGGEGLVLVDQTARIGARAAKRKVKQTDTHDLVVESIDPKLCTVRLGIHAVAMCRPSWARVGMLVEVECDGYYASGLPRFARVVRPRCDLN